MKIASGKLYPLIVLCGALLCAVPNLAFAEGAAPKSSESKDDGADEKEETSTLSDDDAESEEKKPEEKNRINIGVGLSASIDQGTFARIIDSEGESVKGQTTNQGFSMGLSGSLGYSRDRHSLSLGFGISQYLIGGFDKTSNVINNMFISDVSLSYSPPSYTIEPINTTISGRASVQFPTSARSRQAHLYLGTSLGVSASISILDSIRLSLGLSGSKSFHEFTGPVADVTLQDSAGLPAIVYNPNEYIGGNLAKTGGLFTEWTLGPSVSLGWSLWGLSFGLGYSYSYSWSYASTQHVDCNPIDRDGSHVVDCQDKRRKGDSSGGSFTISYSFSSLDIDWLKNFGISLTAQNFSTPKTDDNHSFTFPFWNFSGAAANSSALTLSLSYGYGFGF